MDDNLRPHRLGRLVSLLHRCGGDARGRPDACAENHPGRYGPAGQRHAWRNPRTLAGAGRSFFQRDSTGPAGVDRGHWMETFSQTRRVHTLEAVKGFCCWFSILALMAVLAILAIRNKFGLWLRYVCLAPPDPLLQ